MPKLFLLIRSCNRSVPCMEVVSYAVQVLLHLARVGAARRPEPPVCLAPARPCPVTCEHLQALGAQC